MYLWTRFSLSFFCGVGPPCCKFQILSAWGPGKMWAGHQVQGRDHCCKQEAHSVSHSVSKATLIHPCAPVMLWWPNYVLPHWSSLTKNSLAHLLQWLLFSKSRKSHVLVRIWRNLNAIWNGAASVESNMLVPQKVKQKITIWSSNFTSKFIQRIESRDSLTYMPLFIAALATIAKS